MQNQHYQEIKKLLKQMQTEAVSAAELKLAEYAQFPNFMLALIQIMRDRSNQEWLKTVAASSLNNTLLNYVEERSFEASQILKSAMFDPWIKTMDKRCLEKSLIRTISHGGQQIRNQWQLILGQFLKTKQNFDSAYLVLACFAVADEVPCVVLRTIVQNYFEPIVSSLEVCIDNANLLNQMIKMWIVIIDSLRREEENNEALYFMANSQKLLDLIDLLYQLESIDNVVVCLNPVFCQLNLLKYEAAELNKRLIIFASDSGIACRTLEEYLRKNFNKFAKTLFALSQKRQLIDNLGCQDLLTTLISIQKQYLSLNYQEFSYEVAISLIEHEIFPFLIINDEEREKFEESPEDFNSLTEDCCDKQTYGILKTEACKLLETIGDKIVGCHKYIFNRAIDSIKVGMGFVTTQMDQAFLPVETSFLVLSIFSYGIGRFEQELAAIKVIICDERIKSLPPIEMSRVFTFLAYNYNEIYKTASEGENWIGFALGYHVHNTTRYCAFDFLSNVVDDYFNQIFLEALINEIATSQISLIWQITTKIIENHFSRLSTPGIIKIIAKLYERIQLEINLIENKQKNNTLDLNNSIYQFSIILITLKENMPEGGEKSEKYQQVLQSIWHITEFYRAALKWDLEDEIVKVATHILNVIPSVVPALHPLIPEFIVVFKANQYIQKVYMRFFNQFALKADFQNDQKSLIDIIIVLKDALLNHVNKVSIQENGKLSGTQPERVSLSNILIVIQNILAMHGTNLMQVNSLQFFNQIGSLCLRLLPSADQAIDGSSTGRIIMSRALNTLFLCHMHSKTECFYDYLSRLKAQNLYHGYDTLVFTLCVAKEVFRETDFSVLTLLIESLMQIIEKSNEKEDNFSKKKKGKSKIKINAQLKKINDMDRILKTISSPFGQDLSVGEQVIKLFTSMHAGNAQMVKHILQSLTPEAYSILKKYVDVENLGKKKRIIRKIIGIKQGPNVLDVELNIHPTQSKRADEFEDESEEEQAGPKRQRTKNKLEKKKNIARKINPTTSYQ